ncbi:type VI secretion system baseplate subunit TssG [Bacteroides sp. OttesenSCG-928-D19]|nr:type VI secretion system baseplate subunit TssG [Bacteroides sp. OttesenSCG-928-D19]
MQDEIYSSTKTVNNADTDYKAEVVAASLIEQGFNPEQIMIVRDGIFRRSISTEVEKVYQEFSNYDLVDYLCIRANKEGMYDMLPQGLFHQPINKYATKDKEDILEEIRIHRTEEFFARKFFHLFELIADRTLTNAYLFEAKYDRKTRNSEFTDLFSHYWSVLQLLTLRQAVFFMHVIPLLHRIRSHYRNMEQAFSLILEIPVKISAIKLPKKKADDIFESRIGENGLGVDFVLGNEFDDGIHDLELTIGPMPAAIMKNYLETAKGYRILEQLCEIFLPAHAFVVYDFIIDPQDSQFILSDENHSTYLGINSFI